MRVVQGLIGIAVVIIGILALLALNGWLAFTAGDIAAATLMLSALFFIVPALIWRRELPWLTSLFLPGMLALACGAIVLYAGHTYWSELLYLWVVLVVALGLGFMGMYYLGPRVEWLRIVGVICCAAGLFLVSIALIIFASLVAARVAGSVILIILGLTVAFRGLLRGRPSSHLLEIHK